MHYNIKGVFWVLKILIWNWFQLEHFQKCLGTFRMFGNIALQLSQPEQPTKNKAITNYRPL